MHSDVFDRVLLLERGQHLADFEVYKFDRLVIAPRQKLGRAIDLSDCPDEICVHI